MILFYSISGPLSCLVHPTKYLGETCSGCPLTSAFILAHCTQSLWTLLQGSILPPESRCKRRHFSAFISLKFLSIGHSVKPLLPGNSPHWLLAQLFLISWPHLSHCLPSLALSPLLCCPLHKSPPPSLSPATLPWVLSLKISTFGTLLALRLKKSVPSLNLKRSTFHMAGRKRSKLSSLLQQGWPVSHLVI